MYERGKGGLNCVSYNSKLDENRLSVFLRRLPSEDKGHAVLSNVDGGGSAEVGECR